jgi:hypothetical protein
MRWRTYEKLKYRHDTWALKSLAGMERRLALVNWRLTGIQERFGNR